MLYDAKHGNGGVVTPRFRAASQLGDAADSPIVDDAGDANQFRAGVLVNYTF